MLIFFLGIVGIFNGSQELKDEILSMSTTVSDDDDDISCNNCNTHCNNFYVGQTSLRFDNFQKKS